MNEQEYLTRIGIANNLPEGDMLRALSLETCRNWLYQTDEGKPVHDLKDPHFQELEAMLPRGYRRIPHV